MLNRAETPTAIRKSLLVTIAMLLAGSATIAVPSCRRAESAFDCASVCARYRDCIDIKYDVAACRARCRQRASAEVHYQRKADACEACIRGQSCMGAAFECGGQCLGVVP
jgi:hypothetical protein